MQKRSSDMQLLRTRDIRMRAKEAGKAFDEYEEGIEWQSEGIDVEKLLKGMFTASNGTERRATAAVDSDGDGLPKTEEVPPKTVPNAVV